MWTKSIGLVLFVTLAGTAFYVGQIARRRFPRTYTTIDKALSSLELILLAAVLFGLFYFTR
ncbi:hypothetical protein ML401_17510 [Bradyrhizobium sp. 62B]|jgi:hypothetical protein|uniref:hypothetical protein n=1 Tax=Bradyrhizobium TaxID=374 RepID=UPI002167D9C5|nr:hypothetical protein [Bradyrhizobium centrosematis]MCS3759349.1 hypothetical protein [Bradyrhizobium centrosematis]MCS3772761.1 hypothetical protein [Bradyrhizobium centrosematis]WIW43339.1 hypothetical protein ML401_17510 [Bradyrhizobium sp. 62B]